VAHRERQPSQGRPASVAQICAQERDLGPRPLLGLLGEFAEFDGPEIQHEGYATCRDYGLGAGYEWVCRKCFDDLKDDLGWAAA